MKLAAKSKGLKPQMQAVLQSCLISYGALSEQSTIQVEPSKLYPVELWAPGKR
jgi:hypothetical protein